MSGLAQCAPLRCRLHQQPLQGDDLSTIRAVAVASCVEAHQGGFHLGQFVAVTLFLRAAQAGQEPLRRLVVAVQHLVRGAIGQLSPGLLGSADLGAQFEQPEGQQIAQFRRLSVCGGVHDRFDMALIDSKP